jgi:AAHS family 3-hydroxyphenylpropionic acid transporter
MASIPLIAVAAIAALLVVARFPRGQLMAVAH